MTAVVESQVEARLEVRFPVLDPDVTLGLLAAEARERLEQLLDANRARGWRRIAPIVREVVHGESPEIRLTTTVCGPAGAGPIICFAAVRLA